MGGAHLPSFCEKEKDSFVSGRLKRKVIQLLDGPLTEQGPVVMGCAVERAEPALPFASGSTGRMERRVGSLENLLLPGYRID